ncbi:arsenate reductase (glutaredoxin) [Corynebacterium epidermidicanis]|uniref:Glutaredoxin-dependent arsenate reductase n=1 Tax=Corynebacterium epidermidicanis TaxID=1050174 RepID=A0A0G3GQG5_9CORY|nr:arsenate reductase (glutaredoxin) [Corynebacterium epidermidicanis]AKK02800.1 glutaredoxin-dependent arsenate reductase [Corynebacterium epidermidicanis]
MQATIYHNPRCSKSRAALSYLEENGHDVTVVRYLETPPDVDKLRALLASAGLSPHDAIRTKEPEYRELGLSESTPDDELLAAMVAHPKLIERPIVVTDNGARLARPTELIDDIL